MRELAAREVDEIDLDALRRQPVEQRLDEPFGLTVKKAGTVEEIDADDAQGLLLRRVLEVEHAHMHHDLLGLAAGLGLKLHPHPAVTVVVTAKTARRHRVREGKEGRLRAALRAESLEVQALLVVEHGLETLAANIAPATAVDRVADLHVVGRDAFGDRAGGAARKKEPAHDFLARTDLGKRAVKTRVEIDLEGLVARRDGMRRDVSLFHPRRSRRGHTKMNRSAARV